MNLLGFHHFGVGLLHIVFGRLKLLKNGVDLLPLHLHDLPDLLYHAHQFLDVPRQHLDLIAFVLDISHLVGQLHGCPTEELLLCDFGHDLGIFLNHLPQFFLLELVVLVQLLDMHDQFVLGRSFKAGVKSLGSFHFSFKNYEKGANLLLQLLLLSLV